MNPQLRPALAHPGADFLDVVNDLIQSVQHYRDHGAAVEFLPPWWMEGAVSGKSRLALIIAVSHCPNLNFALLKLGRGSMNSPALEGTWESNDSQDGSGTLTSP